MTERPILFSGPMVRAILEGRKTQTRRVLKPQPRLFEIDERGTPCQVGTIKVEGRAYNQITLGSANAGVIESNPRLYSIGDTLWVREAWRTEAQYDHLPPRDLPDTVSVSLEADYSQDLKYRCSGKLRPSIFMPRWASWITLRVTDVKAEPLQDISEADAMAEGISTTPEGTGFIDLGPNSQCFPTLKEAFQALWTSINGQASWDANPWVVAYAFERVT